VLCRDCPQYQHCTELCMDAELFVNQDYVPLTEFQKWSTEDFTHEAYGEKH